jgi:hypothetical protein
MDKKTRCLTATEAGSTVQVRRQRRYETHRVRGGSEWQRIGNEIDAALYLCGVYLGKA